MFAYSDKASSYHSTMELTYNELSKKDVINIADGRCLGRITNIKLKFPDGRLIGIYVPGRRRRGIFCLFDRSENFIDESRVIKIGGDVILVDVSCNNYLPPNKEIKPHCPHPNSPHCPPPIKPNVSYASSEENFIKNVGARMDMDDY